MNLFVLSDGRVTADIPEYVLDLFRLVLSVLPGDIPGLPDFGFDFRFAGVPSADLPEKVEFRAKALVEQIGKSFPTHSIELTDLEVIDSRTVRLEVTIDGSSSSSIYIDIHENS